MTIVQESYAWWCQNIFEPYESFIYGENWGWTTIVAGVVITILLGLFYKPNKHSIHSHFMEHYGFPLLVLFIGTFLFPVFSVILVLFMPFIAVIGGGCGILLGLFICLQKLRERYLLEKAWRSMVKKKGDYE